MECRLVIRAILPCAKIPALAIKFVTDIYNIVKSNRYKKIVLSFFLYYDFSKCSALCIPCIGRIDCMAHRDSDPVEHHRHAVACRQSESRYSKSHVGRQGIGFFGKKSRLFLCTSRGRIDELPRHYQVTMAAYNRGIGDKYIFHSCGHRACAPVCPSSNFNAS